MPTADCNLHSLCCQHFCNSRANTFTTAGYICYFVVEVSRAFNITSELKKK